MLEHACGQKEIQSTRPYLSTRKPTQSRDPEMWSFKMKSAQDTLTHRHTHTHPHTRTHTHAHTQTLSLSLSLPLSLYCCCGLAQSCEAKTGPLRSPACLVLYEANIFPESASKVCGPQALNVGVEQGTIAIGRQLFPDPCCAAWSS